MTIKTAGIGFPVKKSKSPLIYNYWAKLYGLDFSYDLCEWKPQELESGLRSLISQDYKGFSVTTPHKTAVYNLCDVKDDTANAMGAVNSVTIRGGKLHGTNTDGYGFMSNIIENVGANCFSGVAAVLGAGGAARAVLHALVSRGVPEIRLANRTMERAMDLAADAPGVIKVFDWKYREAMLDGVQFLVNTTSLGMEGASALDLTLKHLPKTAIVNDIVYYPLMTPLLQTAKDRGNVTVTGIGMLLHQARPSFKNWTGIDPDVTLDLQKMVLG